MNIVISIKLKNLGEIDREIKYESGDGDVPLDSEWSVSQFNDINVNFLLA